MEHVNQAMETVTAFLKQHGLIKSSDPEWFAMAYVAVTVAAVLAVVGQFVSSASSGKPKKVLKPDQWQEFKLIRKDHITHNTALYRFGLPPNSCLGLPIGQHISVSAEINGKTITRSYTPTTLDDDLGHFDLIVKTYEKGNISRYLSLLTIGQKIKVKGPKGKFHYTPTLSPFLLMIAGGSGITPMYQIIRASLKDETDKTQLRLIYGNLTEEDILLRKELEELEKASNGRLKVFHVLNTPPAGWTQGTGFITREFIEDHMPHEGVGSPHNGSKVLLCGPPPMITAMKGHLDAIGFPKPNAISKLEDQVFCF